MASLTRQRLLQPYPRAPAAQSLTPARAAPKQAHADTSLACCSSSLSCRKTSFSFPSCVNQACNVQGCASPLGGPCSQLPKLNLRARMSRVAPRSTVSLPPAVTVDCSIPGSEDVLAASPENLFVSLPLLRFEERAGPSAAAAAAAAATSMSDANNTAPSPRMPASSWQWPRCGRHKRTARETTMSSKMEAMFVRAQRDIVHSTRVRGIASLGVGLLMTASVKERVRPVTVVLRTACHDCVRVRVLRAM